MSLRDGAGAPRLHAATDAAIDVGLRSYMLKVYNLMGVGLVATGLAAFATYALATTSVPNEFGVGAGLYLTDFGRTIFLSPLKWLVMLSPLAIVFWLSFGVGRMSGAKAQGVFWLLATVMGVGLSSIFIQYTAGSIAQVFFATAAGFGALSLYGYTTRTDLSAFASFLVIGLFGLIAAMVVNLFVGSAALDFAISAAGVLVFAGLTAWDTQKIKEMYSAGDSGDVVARKATMGALELYLDFLNLFLFLLRLFGVKTKD